MAEMGMSQYGNAAYQEQQVAQGHYEQRNPSYNPPQQAPVQQPPSPAMAQPQGYAHQLPPMQPQAAAYPQQPAAYPQQPAAYPPPGQQYGHYGYQ